MVSRFVRRVRTASGPEAVQVVTRQGRAVIAIDHVGSARTDADLALLLAAAQDRLRPGQGALDLDDTDATPVSLSDTADWTRSSSSPASSSAADEAALLPASDEPGPLASRGPAVRAKVAARGKVVSTSSLLLWDVLARAYTEPGSMRWPTTRSARWSWLGSWSRPRRRTDCGCWTKSGWTARRSAPCSGR